MTPSRQVIFVDDDADVRDAYGQALSLAGFDVVAVRALIEAVDHLSPGYPGIVVTDIRMPGRDGFDMLARTRKIDPQIPVIVLTGEGDVTMALEAMRAGACDFLEKPCAPKTLIEAIERALAQRADTLKARHAALSGQTLPKSGTLPARMEVLERQIIIDEMTKAGGHVPTAAKALGLPRKTLYDKLKRHGIDPGTFRAP